jgi:pilus assembly protein TadC
VNNVIGSAAVLAAALLVAGPPTGRLRLRALAASPATVPAVATSPVRPVWLAVGSVAVGALTAALGGLTAGMLVGALAGAAGVIASRRSRREQVDDTTDLAGQWELLAVCLQAGMPVATAVAAAAEPLAGSTGAALRRVAGLLELGADPADAWQAVEGVPAIATFARAAGRSAGTGAALAQVARSVSERVRADLIDTAQARAQRAAVLITGPLGLCYLPAFVVLGIAPVVVGLASEVLAQW